MSLPELSADAPLVLRRRLQLGLTQRQLAERAGVDKTTVQRLERGDRLSLPTMKRLVTALGGSVEVSIKFPLDS